MRRNLFATGAALAVALLQPAAMAAAETNVWTARAIATVLARIGSELEPQTGHTLVSSSDRLQDLAQQQLDAEALEEFLEEVEEYAELHRRLEKTLARRGRPASPAEVHAREVALEKLIAAARPHAQEGDLFVSEIRPMLRRHCRDVLAGPDGRALLDEIREEQSERRLRARVNERYPDDVPLSAVPYQLLKVLPPLPEELEYRVLGRDLILLDAFARIVVDFLRDAIPR
jgi:hypothetical protein